MAKAVKKGSAKKSAKVSKLAKKSAASKKKGVTKTVKKAVKKVVKKGAKKAVKSKSKKVLVVPKGYHSITPYLIVGNAANAIEFYKKQFVQKKLIPIAKATEKEKNV